MGRIKFDTWSAILWLQEFFPSLNLNKIRAIFSFGAVEDPKRIVMIRNAIIQAEFSLDGIRSSTRLDLVRFCFKVLLLMKFSPILVYCSSNLIITIHFGSSTAPNEYLVLILAWKRFLGKMQKNTKQNFIMSLWNGNCMDRKKSTYF